MWIEHFRTGNAQLADRLLAGLILTHPWVSGELLCGNLKDRVAVLSDLNTIASVKVATDSEVIYLLEDKRLWGRGLGWVDIHLLASALLAHCRVWTFDKELDRAAGDLGLK